MGRTLDDINQSKILYDPMEIKTKVNKWDLIKLKSFCSAKETVSKVKRQPSEREKIIGNETTDKGLISKIHKQLIQLNTRKTNKQIKQTITNSRSLLKLLSIELVMPSNLLILCRPLLLLPPISPSIRVFSNY